MEAVILRIVIYTLIAYGVLRLFEWRSLYCPSKEIKHTPEETGLKFEDVTFVTEDDIRLNGWWIPHKKARGTVIMFHGNGGNIGGRVAAADDLHSLRLNVFLFDYRGYGRSRGITTEKGTYKDARAAYEYVRMRYQNVEKPPVILYGRSLGGAVAAQCALDKPIKGLILESTFSSTSDMAREMYPWLPIHSIITFKYNTVDKIEKVSVPLLISGSVDDNMIPSSQGKKVFDRAKEPKRWIDLTGGHNDAGWMSSPAYWKTLEEFVNKIFSDKE